VAAVALLRETVLRVAGERPGDSAIDRGSMAARLLEGNDLNAFAHALRDAMLSSRS
jgi:hypothetical protein